MEYLKYYIIIGVVLVCFVMPTNKNSYHETLVNNCGVGGPLDLRQMPYFMASAAWVILLLWPVAVAGAIYRIRNGNK